MSVYQTIGMVTAIVLVGVIGGVLVACIEVGMFEIVSWIRSRQ